MSYVIPKLICNSCPCQEGGDIKDEDRWRKVLSLMNHSGLEIYRQNYKFNQHTSNGVWLSLFESSLLLLIMPVNVIIYINNVWKNV